MRCTRIQFVRTMAVGVLASLAFAGCSSDTPDRAGGTEVTSAPETTGAPETSLPPTTTAPVAVETVPVTDPTLPETTVAAGTAGSLPDGVEYTDYVKITDDTGLITLEVPVEWIDVDGSAVVYANERPEPTVRASPDLERYAAFWDTPGVFFAASTELAASETGELLEVVAPPDCVSISRESYDDGTFAGDVEVFGECGGTPTKMVIIAAKNKTGDIAVVVSVQLASRADSVAFDRIQQSFNLTI